MNSHCKPITRKPIVAQSTLQIKTDQIIAALTEIVGILTGEVVPFISNVVDIYTLYMRQLPWFS